MPKAPVTRINGAFQVQANTASNNSNNGLYAPQLTTAQIAAIPAGTLINGAIVYNTTLNTFQVYQNGAWVNLTTSSNPAGYTVIASGAADPNTIASPIYALNNVVGTLYFSTTAAKLWACSTPGVGGTAVWKGITIA